MADEKKLKDLLRGRPTINPDCQTCIRIDQYIDEILEEDPVDKRPIVPESWVCSCGQKLHQEVMEYRIRCQVCEIIYRGNPIDGTGNGGMSP